jgi:hypothetical protein
MKSLESGLYDLFCNDMLIVFEIGFILSLTGIFAGPKFLAISAATFASYFAWIFFNTKTLLPYFKEGF